MRPYSAPFGDDRLHMPVEGDDFRLDSDLFHEFARERGGQRLADFDAAAGQAEMADERRPRPADDERPACRNTAAETARIGRAGNRRSFMGSPPSHQAGRRT